MSAAIAGGCRPSRFDSTPAHKLRARAGLAALRPISVGNAFSRPMRRAIRATLEKETFDLVELEYTPMAQFVDDLNDATCVLGIQDVMFAIAQRYARTLPWSRQKLEWFLDGQLCRRYEPRVMARFDRVITVSQKSKDLLLSQNPDLKITVVPPGVDPAPAPRRYRPGRAFNLIFMGAMWRQTNIDAVLYFYHAVLDRIRREVPDVKFHVVGGRPSAEIRKLASDPAVRVTGYVRETAPYYERCDVAVVPMRIAGGIMCKVLDAMAAGLPVVTTSQGNEGVGALPDKEVIVADDAGTFARRTVELLCDGAKRKAIGTGGRRFVNSTYNWNAIINRLENTYRECVSAGRKTVGRDP